MHLRFRLKRNKSFYTEFKADKKVRKQIDLKYRGHIDQLEDILSKRHVFTSLFEDRTERIQPAVAHLKKNLTKAQIYNLIASHVHMCINRLTKTNPRMHELVLYGILEKYYKRCVGIAKYSAKKELV
jgi:thiopeptide-type bacteriocin biosynthesis protein